MFQKSELENGIRVVSESMTGVRSVSIGILVAASLRDETMGHTGLAHLTEHMMFQGTASRDSLEIARMVDESGGSMGAFTGRDYTFFQFSVLDDFTTYAIDLLGDVLLYSTFPDGTLEREKEVILREIDSERDNPSERAHSLMKNIAWPNHLLGSSIAGDHEAVKSFSREDIIYFVHEHYLPNRLIVSAAGNVDHAEFLSQTRDALWRIIGENPLPKEVEPTFQPAVAVETMPVSMAYFCIGFQAGRYDDEDRYIIHVINEILGGGYSSRLFRDIREKRGLAYSLGSSYHAYLEGGMMVVEGSTAPEHFSEVFQVIMYLLYGLMTGGMPVDGDELFKSTSQVKGKHLISGEYTHTKMGALATQEFYLQQHVSSQDVTDHINAVTLEDIERVAGGRLLPALTRPAVAVVGPDDGKLYSEESIRKTLEMFQ